MKQTLGDALERFPHGVWLPHRIDGTIVPKLIDTDELSDVLGKLRNAGFPQAQLSAPIKWGEDGSLQLHFYPQGWKTFVRLVKHEKEEVGRGGWFPEHPHSDSMKIGGVLPRRKDNR